jgi:acetyl-CoA synthetase
MAQRCRIASECITRNCHLALHTVTVILPVPAAAIESALRRLRLFPLLDGYRNHPVANLDGLIGTIAAIADAAEGLEILEVEVNPLIALRDGSAVAVDAVIRLEH